MKAGIRRFIQEWISRLEEFVKQGHNGDADDQQCAEFDGQFLFHLLDVAFQFSSGDLKIGLDFVNIVLQFGPDLLKVGLDLLNGML